MGDRHDYTAASRGIVANGGSGHRARIGGSSFISHPLVRMRIIAVFIVCLSLIIVGKLYVLQIMNRDAYRERAEHQYVHPNQKIFDRGALYFTNKDTSLYGAATVKAGFMVTANPSLVQDAASTTAFFTQLSKNFNVPFDEAKLGPKIADAKETYVELAKRISPAMAKEIEEANVPGLSLYRDRWRYYPGDTLAANTLGLMGYKDDDFAGRYGLERYYDEVLKREDAAGYNNFFAELFTGINSSIGDKSDLAGDVITTIEPTVQLRLEKELALIEEKWKSDMSGAIVMDPYTGAIYAMAVTPSFDANDPTPASQKNGISVLSNPLVEDVYEMGSTIKPLTMAAGLDVGAVTPTTMYDDTGSMTVDGFKISNYDGRARGRVSMQEVLNQSLNLGVAFVVRTMGKTRFADYMRNFGIGEETGIDLPNEGRGLINNLESTHDVEYATASFGQGIAMTPIATVRALAALGNGGYLNNPHLAERIDYRLGISKDLHKGDAPGRQVIKPETSEAITRMLVEVVDKALRNGSVKMEHYSIAAKTGTAQIARKEGRGYYDDRNLHSFFGYFPAYKPRFIVFFYTIYPKEVKYASETLTDPFMDMAKFLINYYEVPPDR